MVIRTITDVDARIDGHVHVAPRVLDSDETCGESEISQQQVVFQIAADVGAVDAKGIVTVRSFDMMGLCQRFTEVAADQVFVAQFGSEGRAPSLPVEIAAEVHAIDIRAVVVVFHLLWLSAIALIAVAVLVPVEADIQVQRTLLGSALYGGKQFCGVLILLVGLPFWRGPEGTRSPALVSQSQMPTQSQGIVLILSLVERLCPTVVSIQTSCLRSAIAITPGIIRGERRSKR